MSWGIAIVDKAPITECTIKGHRYPSHDKRTCIRCGYIDERYVVDLITWWQIFDQVARVLNYD